MRGIQGWITGRSRCEEVGARRKYCDSVSIKNSCKKDKSLSLYHKLETKKVLVRFYTSVVLVGSETGSHQEARSRKGRNSK